ncbi:TetR/AcrR family transcriptional regulator [Kineosporia sp. J2-2]|uniref:TetR/AcrR family transcriptional regulator n=1 Tax=Kineosporia corallincola TaxID=2835133 RepID=A0ABS5TMB4_9ACTN|nr:TetR/AcrR family transcriptional regulator [Kineosporia corallincola]MBT0771983.1 TetR/AcrR family transcriptional regulator [Kineosporia corallincola]
MAGDNLRADTHRTRQKLLDAAGELLRERGLAFTLPDLARRSGVSTATTYRHFDDVHAVYDGFYRRTQNVLLARLHATRDTADPLRAFEVTCREWVLSAMSWGRAATHIRSARGYLERIRDGDDPLLGDLDSTLTAVVRRLVEHGELPDVDLRYSVLIWITTFDERVIVDLSETLRWGPEKIAETLGRSVLAAWVASPGWIPDLTATPRAARTAQNDHGS